MKGESYMRRSAHDYDPEPHGEHTRTRLRMREKFELASKVIGLIFVCVGIITGTYMAHLTFFGGSEYNELLQMYREGGLSADRLTLNALFSAFQVEQAFHVKLLMVCLLQIPIGMYLMRPNNFFVRWGFPKSRRPVARRAEIIPIKTAPPEKEELPSYPFTKKISPKK